MILTLKIIVCKINDIKYIIYNIIRYLFTDDEYSFKVKLKFKKFTVSTEPMTLTIII